MSHTQPNLTTAALFEAQAQAPAAPAAPASNSSPDQLEFECVNLISQFENQIDSAKSRSNHVENAGANADKLLAALLDFCDKNFVDGAPTDVMALIEQASIKSLFHKDKLNGLGWGFAISNLFGKSVCSDDGVRETYEGLGEALLSACVGALRAAVATVGSESETGKSIEQSIAVFVEEFKANW